MVMGRLNKKDVYGVWRKEKYERAIEELVGREDKEKFKEEYDQRLKEVEDRIVRLYVRKKKITEKQFNDLIRSNSLFLRTMQLEILKGAQRAYRKLRRRGYSDEEIAESAESKFEGRMKKIVERTLRKYENDLFDVSSRLISGIKEFAVGEYHRQ